MTMCQSLKNIGDNPGEFGILGAGEQKFQEWSNSGVKASSADCLQQTPTPNGDMGLDEFLTILTEPSQTAEVSNQNGGSGVIKGDFLGHSSFSPDELNTDSGQMHVLGIPTPLHNSGVSPVAFPNSKADAMSGVKNPNVGRWTGNGFNFARHHDFMGPYVETRYNPAIIEISDGEEEDDGDVEEVGKFVGEKRKLPTSWAKSKSEKKGVTADTSLHAKRDWWYPKQEKVGADGNGTKKDGVSEVVDADDEDSDPKDGRTLYFRRYSSNYDPRGQEDRNLRTILQRMITLDEKEEASPDEGLMTIPLLKHQRIALAWMEKSENRVECSGGILADDQGLGKTVSTIALILKARAPISKMPTPLPADTSLVEIDEDEDVDGDSMSPKAEADDSCSPLKSDICSSSSRSNKGRRAGGTLVVCPTSVLRQWSHEIKAKVSEAAKVSVVIYHGSSRTRDPDELCKYDVVLTTYPIVTMEVPKQPLPEEKDEDKRNHEDYGLNNPFRNFPKSKKAKNKKKAADEKALLEAGPLAKLSWYRVVLDEAQSIKNCRTQVARACWGLRAKKRWCLSGTPIQNAIDDLYSYFRFLRFDPLDTYKSFRSEVKDPISRNPQLGYKKLQLILQTVMLRRTKATLIDGEPIVNLPPRYVQLEQAEFSDEERAFYNNLELESRKQFQAYAEQGTLQSNYVNILWMLLRLRQACDHPLLVRQDNAEATQFTNVEAVRKLHMKHRLDLQCVLEGNKAICTICSDVPEEAVVSSCAHVFCRQCISEKLDSCDDATCPYPKCSLQLNANLIYTLAALNTCNFGTDGFGGISSATPKPSPKPKKLHAADAWSWKSSSKIDAVMKILLALPKLHPKTVTACSTATATTTVTVDGAVKEESSTSLTAYDVSSEHTEKAIVFSQWTSMLDLLEPQLKRGGIRYRRLDGTMTVGERDNAVAEFNTNPEITVMIMSLKAASLGLNMVAACHVLLLDVWWNPTTEDQAIDRAHRIGQTRAVHVSRFTVRNTIEDRILALQDRKRQMVSSAFGENEGNNQKSRLTMDDLRFLFSGGGGGT